MFRRHSNRQYFFRKNNKDTALKADPVREAVLDVEENKPDTDFPEHEKYTVVLDAGHGGEEFSYGEYFSLQKQTNGQWYTIPVKADNVGFQDIAHILPDGESISETYNLDLYGTLEPGIYWLVMESP